MSLAGNPGKESPSLAAGQEGERLEGRPYCYRGRERGRGRERKGRGKTGRTGREGERL